MFAGQTVIITGASSGLGRQLARDLASCRARCVLHGRQEAELEETATICKEVGGETLTVIGDVTQPEDCGALVEAAVNKFGGVDIYLSNAGLSMWAPFEEVKDLNIFRRLMEVNFLGAVHGMHHALPHLKKSRGQFAAIASIQSRMGVPSHTGYVASKHALEGFCEALRYDVEGTGINILSVHPHWIRGTSLRANACAADGSNVGEGRRSHTSESISAEECSLAVLEALRRRDRELVIPAKLRLVPWLKLFWPGLLRRKVRGKVSGQGEEE